MVLHLLRDSPAQDEFPAVVRGLDAFERLRGHPMVVVHLSARARGWKGEAGQGDASAAPVGLGGMRCRGDVCCRAAGVCDAFEFIPWSWCTCSYGGEPAPPPLRIGGRR